MSLRERRVAESLDGWVNRAATIGGSKARRIETLEV